MNPIKNLKDLKAERIRLQIQLAEQEARLKMDVQMLKEQLQPLNVAKETVGNLLINKDRGLINTSLRKTIDVVLRKGLLRNFPWVLRFAIVFLVKNYLSNKLSEKKPDILETIQNWIAEKMEDHVPAES
jgi:hypothetical protein